MWKLQVHSCCTSQTLRLQGKPWRRKVPACHWVSWAVDPDPARGKGRLSRPTPKNTDFGRWLKWFADPRDWAAGVDSSIKRDRVTSAERPVREGEYSQRTDWGLDAIKCWAVQIALNFSWKRSWTRNTIRDQCFSKTRSRFCQELTVVVKKRAFRA